MRGGRALFHFDNGALDLVACTDAHDGSSTLFIPRMTTARIDKSGMRWISSPDPELRPALTAPTISQD
jgi:hypothetical protein